MRRTITTCALVHALCVGGALVFAHTQESAGKIPITTSSAEARDLYLKGRDLAEKLRATDARRFYEQAVEKDKNFALGYVGLANTVGDDQGVHRRGRRAPRRWRAASAKASVT